MAAPLEHAEFAKHLNTTFRIRLNERETLPAELTEISEHTVSPQQERFWILFKTSNDVFLGQGQRSFEHDAMGNFDLFLVPMSRDEDGTYYEAVFNRLVKKS
jgi:hypothetical protein